MNRLQYFMGVSLAVLLPALALAAPPAEKFADVAASRAAFDESVAPLLKRRCLDCHSGAEPEGDLDLSTLDPDMKASTSAARWAVVLEKVQNGQMPPKDEPKLSAEEVSVVSRWIHAELKRSNKHVAQRAAYANGNVIPNELLFDPKQSAPFDAATGVRRLSPEIYKAFTDEVGKGVDNVTQPFSPEGRTTFKDMGSPKVDEPMTALLIRNALALSEKYSAHKIEGGKIVSFGGTSKEVIRLLDEQQPVAEADIAAVVKATFDRALRRAPTEAELAKFTALFQKNLADAGRIAGVKYSMAAVFLLPEAIFRWELGGTPDDQGRVRLTPREIAFAISYGLTDKRPDQSLLNAAAKGELDTREGVEAAVRKLLDDPKIAKPRIMRFFREYFDYEKAGEVVKDEKLYREHHARALVEDTDRLVQYIVDQDKDVLRELLTTNKTFVFHTKVEEIKRRRIEETAKFEAEKAKDPQRYATKTPPKFEKDVFAAYNLPYFPDEQPTELPREERAGVLTQPGWLVAFSKSDDNDVIHRGKWIRERLLGNVVPDIPITVDAQLPIAPEKTLRERVAVTNEKYCWQCHQLMNNLGLPFEQYDHLGRFRTTELVLDPEATAKNVDKKGKPLGTVNREVPLDTTGGLEHVGDAELQGEVKNAVELIHRLAASERVEQVFIRHVFRFYLGRNETLGDAASLQAAQQAYRESGGSMKALLAALLSSDSFLYRVPSVNDVAQDSTSNSP